MGGGGDYFPAKALGNHLLDKNDLLQIGWQYSPVVRVAFPRLGAIHKAAQNSETLSD